MEQSVQLTVVFDNIGQFFCADFLPAIQTTLATLTTLVTPTGLSLTGLVKA